MHTAPFPAPDIKPPPIEPRLIIGREPASGQSAFGFARPSPLQTGHHLDELVFASPESHVVTVAATGGGKFVSCVAPQALEWPGQLVVLDPKGEAAHVTAKYREKFGQVVILDPFGETGLPTGCLNPFDLVEIFGPEALEEQCDLLGAELAHGHTSAKDPFWHTSATSILGGLLMHVGALEDASRRHLPTMIDMLFTDDVAYNLAVLLDTKTVKGLAYQRIAAFLQTPDSSSGSTRSCILSTAQQFVSCLQPARVRQCLFDSSFSLRELRDGKEPVTIYLVFPPSKLARFAGLFRLWLRCIFIALESRTRVPPCRTLMVIDEAAHMAIDGLPTAMSYLRGAGVSIWSLWQSLAQIASAYPTDHKAIIENARVFQAFSLRATAVADVAGLLGMSIDQVRALPPNGQIVAIGDQPPRVIDRIDYRADPYFRGRAAPNPRYPSL